MISIRVPLTSAWLDFALPFVGLPTWARAAAAAFLAAFLAVLLARLYRYEMRLVPRRLARGLLALRVGTVAAVFLTLCFEPALRKTSTHEVPSRVLVAVDKSDSMRVTDPHRPDQEKRDIAQALRLGGVFPDAFDRTTRLAQVERVLGPGGVDLLGELQKRHAVELMAFDQTPAGLPLDPDKLKAALDADRALDPAASSATLTFTDLKLPLARGGESSADALTSKLIAAVVFTDGRHNWGDSPLGRAAELAARKVPVYPVVMAPPNPPPDVAVVAARAQTATVFKGSTVPVEVAVRVSGWPAGPIAVTLDPPPDEKGNKREPITETIRHTGQDQTYQFALRVKLDAPGPQSLTVAAASDARRDDFPANNRRTARVNVVKDRARVLLVDGEARWEFHYLHTCLGRDENMDVRSVVFRQPRVTKATDDDLKKFGIPARQLPDSDVIAGYDCIVLGDVEPAQLPRPDRERIERYVAEDGGTLVVVAGKRAMPALYQDDGDPLRKLLPVKSPTALSAPDGFRLGVTEDGRRSWFLQLGDTAADSRFTWEGLPPHFWAAVGDPKDGAEVLAEAGGKAAVARQNYGFGRVLYVGVDSTWRWRYRVGDRHHHRFWGQVAQWAASDRLLPTQNAAGTIRFGPREPAFRSGQEVEVIVRATEAVKKLPATALKGARLFKLPEKDGQAERPLALAPLTQPDGRPRDLSGRLRDLGPGKYAVELEIPDWADQLVGPPGPDGRATRLRSTFEVLPPDNEELVELSADLPLLEEIARTTGGKVYTPDKVRELIDQLAAKLATVETQTEYPARKSWLTLAVVLALLAAEWGLRKWAGLP
jgi:hypothetical protein